jgi:hypothetical protein
MMNQEECCHILRIWLVCGAIDIETVESVKIKIALTAFSKGE